jgi:hypothetical protein
MLFLPLDNIRLPRIFVYTYFRINVVVNVRHDPFKSELPCGEVVYRWRNRGVAETEGGWGLGESENFGRGRQFEHPDKIVTSEQ